MNVYYFLPLPNSFQIFLFILNSELCSTVNFTNCEISEYGFCWFWKFLLRPPNQIFFSFLFFFITVFIFFSIHVITNVLICVAKLCTVLGCNENDNLIFSKANILRYRKIKISRKRQKLSILLITIFHTSKKYSMYEQYDRGDVSHCEDTRDNCVSVCGLAFTFDQVYALLYNI